MKGNWKRLLSMALVCLLCWTVPAQALMAVDLPENTAQAETAQLENNSVSGSDILADTATLLANNNTAEVLIEIVDVSGMVYQEGGLGTPAWEAYGIATYAEIPQDEKDELKGKILAALTAGEESLDVSEYGVPWEERTEFRNLFRDVINENPSLFYVDSTYNLVGDGTIVIQLKFSYKNVTDAQKLEFEQKVNEAVALVTDDMSDVEKALVLHDYLAQHCAYAITEYNAGTLASCPNVYDAYGVLVKGKAVCQGYALAYVELLRRVGITSYICESDSMNHAWNVVLIDGNWYHVDVTWDDPTWNREGRACHTYFLLSDTAMESRKSGEEYHHDWVKNVECSSTKYDAESYWWNNVDSQIVQVGHGDYIYVKDTSDGKFQLVRRMNDTETVKYTSESYWNAWGEASSYYPAAFAFLSRQGDSIYFNDKLNVYSMNLDGDEIKTVYTYGEGNGYIYGAMVYEDGKARLNIFKNPNEKKDDYITEELVKVVRVTSVSLDKDSVSLEEGKTLQLTATVEPANADNQKVTWRSGDSDVASVAEDGTVTAVKEGTAVITVITQDGGKTASCTVTVTHVHNMTHITEVKPTCVNPGNVEYYRCSKCGKNYSDEAGTTELAKVTVEATGHTPGAWSHDENQHWKECTVCKEKIDVADHDFYVVVDKAATVDATGLSHEECDCGVKRKENTVIPKIEVSVTGVSLNEISASLAEGTSIQLTANVEPATADNKAVEWSSSNPSVASVDADGKLTAVKEGTAVITVTTQDGGKTASCTVTVTHAHNMAHIAAVDPDCVTPGNVDHYRCSKCNKTYQDEAGTKELTEVEVEATGHAPGAWSHDENKHWKECTVCKEKIDEAAHDFSVVVDKDATENETGLSHEECVCGAKRKENTVIPKLEVLVTGVSLNRTSVSLKEDETLKLTATVEPANADNQAVEWSSSNPAVASVGADGTVTAVKEGTAVITVTTKDGGKTARCTVTVTHAHNMTHISEVKPTCVNPGRLEHYSCSKCGKNYSDEAGTTELAKVTVEAAGHTPGSWSHDGNQHWRECTVCSVETDRADHAFRVVVDKEATEAETGLGHEQCVCGGRGSENIVIPKLEHIHIDIQHHEAVAATCIAKGSVEYWTCSSAKCAGKYYGDSACQAELASIEEPINTSNHIGTGYWSSTSEKHTFHCVCGVVTIDDFHIYDNDMDSACNLCVYRRFYVVIDGADATYEVGTESGLTITADGVYKFFQDVEVDGRVVDAANYEVREGSTIVTLKKAYLDSLPVGTHDIRVLYTDGKVATTKFTIQENVDADDDGDNDNGNDGNDNDDNNDNVASEDTPKALSPKTGDLHQPSQLAAVIMVCIFMIAGIMIYKRKNS